MINYENMSKKLILEIFDPPPLPSIPNTTGLSSKIFIILFYSWTQFFLFFFFWEGRLKESTKTVSGYF